MFEELWKSTGLAGRTVKFWPWPTKVHKLPFKLTGDLCRDGLNININDLYKGQQCSSVICTNDSAKITCLFYTKISENKSTNLVTWSWEIMKWSIFINLYSKSFWNYCLITNVWSFLERYRLNAWLYGVGLKL